MEYCIGNGQVHQQHLQLKAGALNCMHDQQAVMTYESAGFKPRNGANSYSTGYEEEKAPTISTDQNYSVVTYGLDRASFNQGKNAMYDISVQEEIAQPIVARGPGGGYCNSR